MLRLHALDASEHGKRTGRHLAQTHEQHDTPVADQQRAQAKSSQFNIFIEAYLAIYRKRYINAKNIMRKTRKPINVQTISAATPERATNTKKTQTSQNKIQKNAPAIVIAAPEESNKSEANKKNTCRTISWHRESAQQKERTK